MTSFLPVGIHTAGIILTTILLLSFITKNNIFNSGIMVGITALFLGIIELVVSSVFVVFFRVDTNEFLNNPTTYLTYSATVKVIEIAFTFMLFNFGGNRLVINVSKSHNGQYMFVVFQLLLMSLFTASINYNIGLEEERVIYNVALVMLYVLSLALSVFDIREREQMLVIVNKQKILDEYIRNLEDVINVIRREKHDFMNHLQTIYAICKLGKANALESIDSYLKRLTTDLTVSYKFYETGNDYIDGLLAIKSHKCFENDIDLSVNIGASFNLAEADESDIAGILGNILNNAIECLLPVQNNEEKKIQIVTYIAQGRFSLKVINNGPEIPPNMIGGIFEKGVTSKADSEEHGLGLFIVRQMVLKNKGTIGASSRLDKTEFTVTFGVRGALDASSSEYVAIENKGA
jgi:signal transduction histidine kinase